MTIDATGGRVRVYIGGVDYTAALEDGIYTTSPLSTSGLITAECKITLAQSEACPVSLDPLVTNFWQIGLQVQLFFEYSNFVQERFATLIAQTRPVYNEWEQTLELDLVDYITFYNAKTPQDNLDDEDFTPASGKSRREVVNLLTQKTNYSGGLLGNGPENKIYTPTQKFGDRGWLSVAGEIVYGDPDECYYLYANTLGNLDSLWWSEQTKAPKIFFNSLTVPDTQRLQGDEYSKPVEKLFVTSTKIHACDITGLQVVEQRTANYASLVGGPLIGSAIDTEGKGQVPVYRLERDTQIEGNTVTIVETEKVANITSFANVNTNRAGVTYTFKTNRISTFKKEFGIGEDKLGREVTFIKSFERVDQRNQTTGFDRTNPNTIAIVEEMQEWRRERGAWEYDKNFFCIKYIQSFDQITGTLYPTIVPPVGTPDGLIPAQFRGSGADWCPVNETEQKWTKQGCTANNGEEWQLTETLREASAQIGGQSRYELVDTGTEITPNSAPIETERLPLPYNVSEEEIAGNWVARPKGISVFYDTERTENIPWLDDDESCEKKARQIQDLTYGLAQGRNFVFAPDDALVSLCIQKPVFRFDYQHLDGVVNAYLFQGWALRFGQVETVLELDAPLLGELRTYTTSVSGNTIISPGLYLQSGQQVIFYPNYYGDQAPYGLSTGVPYYAYPDGNGGFTVSLTPGGPVVPLTPTSPGTVAPVTPGPIYNYPHRLSPRYRITATFTSSEDTSQVAGMAGYRITATFAEEGLGGPGYRITATFASSGVTAKITSFSPTVGTTGTEVTISGSGLTGATAVSFGGVAASSFIVVSATQIKAIVGTGASGAILITAASGAGLSLSGFQFISTAPSYTDEQAQDAVGNILVDSNTIDFVYEDTTPFISGVARTQQSITSDPSGIKLLNDSASPGNSKYYGTGVTGDKGFFALPGSTAGIQLTDYAGVDTPLTPGTSSLLFSQIRGRFNEFTSIDLGGVISKYQLDLLQHSAYLWVPVGNGSGTTITIPGDITFAGSGTGRSRSGGSKLNAARRIANFTGTSAGSTAGSRWNGTHWTRGDVAGVGGFFARAYVAFTAHVANDKGFVGFIQSNIFQNINPSAETTWVGFYWDGGQTTWRIGSRNNSGSVTSVDLGVNFPTTGTTDFYEFTLFCQPNGSEVFYGLRRINTGQTATGSITTNLPANNVFMNFHCKLNNGTTAASATIESAGMAIYDFTNL